MSAPENDLETQKRRHFPALAGTGLALGWGALMILLLVLWIGRTAEAPDGAEVRIDGITGERVQTED